MKQLLNLLLSVFVTLLFSWQAIEANPIRVLIGAPIVNQNALKQYLKSLSELHTENLMIDYVFIDDTNNERARQLLKEFADNTVRAKIFPASFQVSPNVCDDKGLHSNNQLAWEIAGFRNAIIRFAIEGDYDYFFLVNADVCLHPNTLMHLISQKKDIIGEIYWTKAANNLETPQVWLHNDYQKFQKEIGEQLPENEIRTRIIKFLQKLRIPGIYQVGGFDGCMLISKSALKAGVNFNKIYNLSFQSSAVHFCLRAMALGFELFIDTTYPIKQIG